MPIRTATQGSILEVTIDRPEAMNALDAPANRELGDTWKRFAAAPDLHVAILTGAGDKAFCAGADLKTLIPAFARRHSQEARPIGISGAGSRAALTCPSRSSLRSTGIALPVGWR